MSGYNIDYFIADFSKRTLSNLKVIEQLKAESIQTTNEIFEVTQLINSLFGLIVVTYEAIKPYKNPNKPVDRMRSFHSQERKLKAANTVAYGKIIELIHDLQRSSRYYNSYKEEKDLTGRLLIRFVEHMRNSLAHGGDTGLLFHPIVLNENEQDKIKTVIFEDTNLNDKTERFIVELDLEEIKLFVLLINEIIGQRPNIRSAKSNQKKYDRKIQELRTLMLEQAQLSNSENTKGSSL